MAAKKIVYLIGAGATQAEADNKGGEKINLLMKDSKIHGEGISSRIIKRAKSSREWALIIKKGQDIDIEKLISLFTATGLKKNIEVAEKLREFYFNEILNSLFKANILNNPQLTVALLEMHHNDYFLKNVEKLEGIISLNHDNLFQVASHKVYGGLNLGFNFQSDYYKYKTSIPPIIKLHGSFDWLHDIPIKVVPLNTDSKYDPNIQWIPPTILKESKEYPYNKLMGIAYELLVKNCDILRIIGCSLSQNDWNIISLLFNAQYKNYCCNGKNFTIELIIDKNAEKRINSEYSFLNNIVPLGNNTDGDFSLYKDLSDEGEIEKSALSNIFSYWLKIKSMNHLKKGEFNLKKGSYLKEVIEK